MNIAEILEGQARDCGDRLAIIEPRGDITFGALNRAAASAAEEFARAGVCPGMRALVFSPMSIVLYTTMIALFRLRATAVFVDPSAGRARLQRCIERVRPDAFVAVPRAHWLRLTSRAIRAIPIKAAIGGRALGAVSIGRRVSTTGAPFDIREREEKGTLPFSGEKKGTLPFSDGETPAVITFTSGSTGEPKAAVRTHAFLIAQHRALVESLELVAGETDLCTLPIFLLANLASGVTSLIPDADLRAPGAIDAAPVFAQLRSARPTRTVASPAFLTRLVAHGKRHVGGLDSLRRIYTGGAPVFPRTLDAIAEAAPNAAVVAVYGSTEAEPIAEIDRGEIGDDDRDAMARGAGLLAGRPVLSIRLRIIRDTWGTPVGPWTDAELDRATLAAGEVGEIVVTGEHVLAGYLDGQGDEETKIAVGRAVWHRTGDAGYLDAMGRLWLLGRCSARVSDSAGTLYPFAVECAADAVVGVGRTAFVMHREQRLLVVEIDRSAEGQGDDELKAELLERLAWAKLKRLVLVQRIPVDRRHNAKVEYPALLSLLDRASQGDQTTEGAARDRGWA